MYNKDMASNNQTNGSEKMTTYWKGDLAKYTGNSQELHGETCYELELLEGHRKGDNVWTYRAPK